MSPGNLDPEVVRRHLIALRRAIQNLRRHSSRTAVDLQADSDLRWAVERGLQLAAQNVLDIATHVVAAEGLDVPDYATAIARLGEVGVLPREAASRLRDLAGFRNVLVHGYLEVDMRIVERVLAERLDDLDDFSKRVDAWLAREA